MGARIDYAAGGEAGYTGDLPSNWSRSADSFVGTLLGRIGEGVNRAVDVEIDRVISARRAPPAAPAPRTSAPTVAGFELPEWAPLAGLALAGLVLVMMLAKKG